MKTKSEREAEFKAKIADLDAYVEKMNAKSNKTEEEMKELIKAMQLTNTKTKPADQLKVRRAV